MSDRQLLGGETKKNPKQKEMNEMCALKWSLVVAIATVSSVSSGVREDVEQTRDDWEKKKWTKLNLKPGSWYCFSSGF